MTTKNLDKFSILIAVVAVALTISIMSLTGNLEKEASPLVQETVLAQEDTLATPVLTDETPAADSLEVQPAEENYMEDKDV